MIYNSFCQQAITDSTYSTRYIYTPDSVVCFVNNFYVSYKASPLLLTVAVVSLPPHDHSYWPLCELWLHPVEMNGTSTVAEEGEV